MDKSLLTHLGESLDRYRAARRMAVTEPEQIALHTWVHVLRRQIVPNIGSVLVILILLIAFPSLAAPSRTRDQTTASTGTIAYQGRLANADGSPITNTVNMEFRLYDVPEGGVALWTEKWTGSNAVQVSDGLFNVMLGSLTPIPQSVVTAHDSLFLGITVGTDDEMQPRVQLGTVPWAMQALTVPDGSITTEKLADGAVSGRKTQLTSGKVNATDNIDLPETALQYEELPGTERTLNVDTAQTLLVTMVADIYVDPGCAGGVVLVIDGHRYGTGALYQSQSGGRATVAQTYVKPLSPGSHTVSLAGQRLSGTGRIRIYTHTNYLYLLVGG